MDRPDDEFEDFLTRRKPIFRGIEDPLEPPDELDRLVLHQAREAVEGARPQRVYKGPRWGAPLAIAATLVLAVTVILQVGMPAKPKSIPEVTVQTVAQRMDYPAAPAAQAPAANNPGWAESPRPMEAAADNAESSVSIDLKADTASTPARTGGFVSEGEAGRYAESAAPAAASAPSVGLVVEDPVTGSRSVVDVSPPPTEAERAVAKATPPPAFRGDSRTWLAEIERLRAAGKGAQAEAEYAEYKRQHRAYAVSPDR